MEDFISIGDSLLITLVSMMAVFVILVLIAFLIQALKTISGEKKAKEVVIVETEKQEILIEDNSEEIVAVIAAALAATMGLNLPEINIKSIRRIPQESTPWSIMGKNEQLYGKL